MGPEISYRCGRRRQAETAPGHALRHHGIDHASDGGLTHSALEPVPALASHGRCQRERSGALSAIAHHGAPGAALARTPAASGVAVARELEPHSIYPQRAGSGERDADPPGVAWKSSSRAHASDYLVCPRVQPMLR
jgi:hypothetical protein